METLREFYRIGTGPSSSHTMGPGSAVERFLSLCPDAQSYTVELFGSLAATGRGHLTDSVIEKRFSERGKSVTIFWKPEEEKPFHPNALTLSAVLDDGSPVSRTYYSVGGGKIVEEGETSREKECYPAEFSNMDSILAYCDREGLQLWEFALRFEPDGILEYMQRVWSVMKSAIRRGIENEGVLPGGLKLPRKALRSYEKSMDFKGYFSYVARLMSYALAVMEENAAGGEIVTAPTCGSCGVLPAVLYNLSKVNRYKDERIVRALLTAGVVGNVVKMNGSISGAEVGCQGEVGVACAMAGAAATQLQGGTIYQVEYAAEMGIEHHLGLTCDPIMGLVQIPCIERNAMAAVRAMDNATFVLMGDGRHRVSLDDIIQVMMETGQALPSLYRETSRGGIARVMGKKRR